MFQGDCALFQYAELLVAQRHVMHSEQEDELVMLVLACLNLLQHGLCLLKENKSLFKTFL